MILASAPRSVARVASELSTWIGAVPLCCLIGLWWQGEQRDAAYWWLGIAFGISWLADMLALVVDPFTVSLLYPVSQTSIIAGVFLSRKEARGVLFVLVLVGTVAILIRSPGEPDFLLRASAWSMLVAMAFDLRAIPQVRTALLVYFGLGLLAWTGYVAVPGWTSWLLYQATRAAGLGLFCSAVWDVKPTLQVVRATRRVA